MAFDHPVEADRVDLSFASIMSRAPVIGSLMYLLGGHRAREEEEYEGAGWEMPRDSALGSLADNSQNSIKSALKKGSPSLASTSAQSDVEGGDGDEQDSSLRRSRKELSWSDESGHSLVEYMEHSMVSTILVRQSSTVLVQHSENFVEMDFRYHVERRKP